MNKKELIKKVNSLLNIVWKDETKAKQLRDMCRDLKLNTTYNNNVLMTVKPTMTIKEISLLIDCIVSVL